MGWIMVDRSLQEHDLWRSEPFTRGQAWVDLILLANHKPGMIRRRGIAVKVKRGQVGYSQDALAARWLWSEGKVKRFLNELKEREMITRETALKNVAATSLITITNYDRYQFGGPEDGPEDGPENGAKPDPKTVPEQEREDVKKGKKGKTTSTPRAPVEGFLRFWKVYPKKVKRQQAEEAWSAIQPDEGLCQAIVDAVHLQHGTVWTGLDEGTRYIPDPANWLTGRRWEDEVDESASGYNGPKRAWEV